MLFFDKINWNVKACFDMKKQACSLHKSQAMFFILALNSPRLGVGSTNNSISHKGYYHDYTWYYTPNLMEQCRLYLG